MKLRGRHDRWSIYPDSLVGRADLEGPTGAAGLGRGGGTVLAAVHPCPQGEVGP